MNSSIKTKQIKRKYRFDFVSTKIDYTMLADALADGFLKQVEHNTKAVQAFEALTKQN